MVRPACEAGLFGRFVSPALKTFFIFDFGKRKLESEISAGLIMAKVLITKKTTIGEVISKYPKAAFVFLDYGLHCIGCAVATDETIEEAARAHHIDLKKFLRDLNSTAKKG